MPVTTPVVRIDRLAAGGEGVGRLPDGRAVFVPRTAAGDLVELKSVREHRRFARATPNRLIESGPGRVAPPCPHYVADWCGGCQLQHLNSDAQRAARRSIVGDAVRRIARRQVPDPALEPAPAEWNYRTRLTLHQSADGRRIGFHRWGRPGEIFDLQTCLLADQRLLALWNELGSRRTLLPPRFESLTLRLERGGNRHLLVRGVEGASWTTARSLSEALAAAEQSTTVWWQPHEGSARVMGPGEAYPATVFEQVHPSMGDRVRAHAIEALGDVAGRHVWDLYAGIGETSVMLLQRGASVESVEADGRAVQLAERLSEARAGIVRHTGRAEDVSRRHLKAPALVVTNPPRGGMDADVIQAIVRAAPRRVVYISCDAATLARDLARFGDGWTLLDLRCFDLFPQTAHVESVAVLEPV